MAMDEPSNQTNYVISGKFNSLRHNYFPPKLGSKYWVESTEGKNKITGSGIFLLWSYWKDQKQSKNTFFALSRREHCLVCATTYR